MHQNQQKRSRIKQVIQRLDEALSELDDPGQTHDTTPSADGSPASEVQVMVGTSQMAQDDPGLVRQINQMVNTAYYESNFQLLSADTSGYERVSEADVMNRLAMGDAGPRANRVLHLAQRNGALVGCCSSTFQPPWTPEGCGHWGLLVVDKAAQGTGVASALVLAAEERLASSCAHVQIEYEYTSGHSHSERLMDWYERKSGFNCAHGNPRRIAPWEAADSTSAFGETEFRRCTKQLPLELIRTQVALECLEYDGLGGLHSVNSFVCVLNASSSLPTV